GSSRPDRRVCVRPQWPRRLERWQFPAARNIGRDERQLRSAWRASAATGRDPAVDRASPPEREQTQRQLAPPRPACRDRGGRPKASGPARAPAGVMRELNPRCRRLRKPPRSRWFPRPWRTIAAPGGEPAPARQASSLAHAVCLVPSVNSTASGLESSKVLSPSLLKKARNQAEWGGNELASLRKIGS